MSLRERLEALVGELRGESRDPEAHHVARSTFALCADRLTALLAEAGAEADTWQAVHAVAQEANHLPPGTGGPGGLSREEADARYALIDSARAYREGLVAAEKLPSLREAYHRDLARFRTLTHLTAGQDAEAGA